MKPWPKTRRVIGREQEFPPNVKPFYEKLVAEGIEKIWFIQVSSGNNWEYLPGAFRCRTDPKRVAMKLSEECGAARIVRWISPVRRKRQMDLWRARWSREKMPAGGSKKGRIAIGNVRSLIERLLMTPGHTIRQVAKETVTANQTVNEIAKTLQRPACPCGREVEHKGWCKFRFENHPKRQELLKDKGWSNQEVNISVPAREHEEVTERKARQELRQAQKEFREAKKRLQEAQETVARIYRNQALGIIE